MKVSALDIRVADPGVAFFAPGMVKKALVCSTPIASTMNPTTVALGNFMELN
jgi:hypothetical protein